MFYPKISIISLFNLFKKEFQWVSLITPINDISFSVQSNIPLIQIFNPIHEAWINLISSNEYTHISNSLMSSKTEVLKKIIKYEGILVFCSDVLMEEMNILEKLKCLGIKNCFLTPESIEKVLPILSIYLYQHLAPQYTYHGTLVEIFGRGVLFTGPSGIGKSRTALYCLERGHNLIADDACGLFRFGNQIIGKCPTTLEGLLEIRQLGIVKVNQQFKHLPMKNQYSLDLIVELNNNISLERNITPIVGSENILGINIPKIRLAFSQDIAILVEHAIRLLSNQPT